MQLEGIGEILQLFLKCYFFVLPLKDVAAALHSWLVQGLVLRAPILKLQRHADSDGRSKVAGIIAGGPPLNSKRSEESRGRGLGLAYFKEKSTYKQTQFCPFALYQ